MADPMEQLLRGFVQKGMVAGASALVTQDGREIYFGAEGFADMDARAPMRRDTIVHMFSMTKIVTTVAALTLVDAGRLSLDAPVACYLDEFKDVRVAQAAPAGGVELRRPRTALTVRQLLNMTSGIPYPGEGEGATGKCVKDAYLAMCRAAARDSAAGREWGLRDMTRAIAACPLMFEPGARWMYGLGIDVAGAVIEQITGMRLGDYMQKAIFEPLGMRDSAFVASQDKRGRVAVIYTDERGRLEKWREKRGLGMIDNPQRHMGGAGLLSTADDYTRFARMLLEGGALEGARVLSSRAVREMTSGQLTPGQRVSYNWDSEHGYTYGLGVRVLDNSALCGHDECAGSFGWNGMGGTSIRIDPVRRTTALFLTQRVPPNHADYLPAFTRAVHALCAG